jgi:hypothetical protein
MAKARLTKIVSKKTRITITYEMLNSKSEWDEHTLTGCDEPRVEFSKAWSGLSHHFIDICELPPEFVNKASVTSITLSYSGEDDVMGATISGNIRLVNSDCPLNITTPHKPSRPYSEGAQAHILTGDCVKVIREIEREAFVYIAGIRMQQDLFFTEVQVAALSKQIDKVFDERKDNKKEEHELTAA